MNEVRYSKNDSVLLPGFKGNFPEENRLIRVFRCDKFFGMTQLEIGWRGYLKIQVINPVVGHLKSEGFCRIIGNHGFNLYRMIFVIQVVNSFFVKMD